MYVLDSSLTGLPGLNASRASFALGITGLVEVDVVGPGSSTVGGVSVPGVAVTTHGSGFLNGTFAVAGNATVHASGTFTSDSSEVWEAQSELPTRSNSTTSYVITVPGGIPLSATADLWLNTTTSYASVPAFDLNVGERASAPFTTQVQAATSFSILGFGMHNETQGTAAGTWSRQVLGEENATVEAGTFSTYRLNESLGFFPGLGAAVAAGNANETAWFSNDVGSYVRRQAFVNGTPVAEMRLKSYTYPAAAPGLSLLDLSILAAIPLAAAILLVVLVLRRRRKRGTVPVTGSAGPVGTLPPKPPGGGP